MYEKINVDNIYIQRNIHTINNGLGGKKIIEKLPHIHEFYMLHTTGHHSHDYIDFLKERLIYYNKGNLYEQEIGKSIIKNNLNNVQLQNCVNMYKFFKQNEIYPIRTLQITDKKYMATDGHHRVALSKILERQSIYSFVEYITNDLKTPIEGYFNIDREEINEYLDNNNLKFILQNISDFIISNYSNRLKILEINSGLGYISRNLIKLGFVDILGIETNNIYFRVSDYLKNYIQYDNTYKPFSYSIEYQNIDINSVNNGNYDIIIHNNFSNTSHIMIRPTLYKLYQRIKKEGSIIIDIIEKDNDEMLSNCNLVGFKNNRILCNYIKNNIKRNYVKLGV